MKLKQSEHFKIEEEALLVSLQSLFASNSFPNIDFYVNISSTNAWKLNRAKVLRDDKLGNASNLKNVKMMELKLKVNFEIRNLH